MKKDLTGTRFGKLLVESVHSRTRNGHIRWQCKCDCGREHNALSTHLLSNLITHCGCVPRKSGTDHPQWTGYGEISGKVWDDIKRGSSEQKGRRKLDFDITIEYAWELFVKQNRKCALSGEILYFPHSDRYWADKQNSRNASLDRIDSSKGYIEGNVQWVHKDVNLMKNRLDEERFINLCVKIANKEVT